MPYDDIMKPFGRSRKKIREIKEICLKRTIEHKIIKFLNLLTKNQIKVLFQHSKTLKPQSKEFDQVSYVLNSKS